MVIDEGSAVGDLRQIGLSAAGLGTVSELEGDSRSARPYYDESLKISIGLKDDYGIAITLSCLADLLKKEGELNEAKQLLENALAIYLALGNLQGACNNLNILGQISLEASDDDTAFSYYSRNVEISEELENESNRSMGLLPLQREPAIQFLRRDSAKLQKHCGGPSPICRNRPRMSFIMSMPLKRGKNSVPQNLRLHSSKGFPLIPGSNAACVAGSNVDP
jgi:tetratricopeptide (TPR) repeat protein